MPESRCSFFGNVLRSLRPGCRSKSGSASSGTVCCVYQLAVVNVTVRATCMTFALEPAAIDPVPGRTVVSRARSSLPEPATASVMNSIL